MALDLKKGFNKFADAGNSINHTINNMVGKDIWGDIKKIENQRVFQDYDSFPKYLFPEPDAWTLQEAGDIEFFI